jgi:hypothetical protein
MKLNAFIIIGIIAMSCKSPQKENIQLSTAELIANAHGFSNWDKVERIDFTFRVAFDSVNRDRHWSWAPKSNTVSAYQEDTVITYQRNDVDSTLVDIDRRFINDKFWLLVPFQLVWDQGVTISESITATAPMSQKEIHRITIKYGDQGGYTPGDTYQIFFDDQYIIREWIYQSSDTSRPPRSYSFDNYKEFGGIKFATSHKVHEREVTIDFPIIELQLQK